MFRVADRFEGWRQINNQIGVISEPPEEIIGSYSARLSIVSSQPLSFLSFEADNCPVYRQAAQIRRMEWFTYWIYREIGPGAWIKLGEREFHSAPGDILIADADAPLQTEAFRHYRHHVWMLPHATLNPHLPNLPRPLALHIPVSHPVNALLKAYLDAVSTQMESMSDALVVAVADHVARLIAIAAGASAKTHGETVQAAKLEQARRFAEQNLSRPDLGPDAAATALGISVRQLHLCFEPTGESFGQYVRRRRLEECRAALENPMAASRSVTDIAFAWGFASLPSFYRAFAQAFGMAPGDVRARALTSGGLRQ
jgi:AraC-like DNA-binding protein